MSEIIAKFNSLSVDNIDIEVPSATTVAAGKTNAARSRVE
jgi:hypothetical protein